MCYSGSNYLYSQSVYKQSTLYKVYIFSNSIAFADNKRAFVAVLHTGMAKGHGGNPVASIRVDNIYCVPVLLSGLTSLKKVKIDLIDQNVKKNVDNILRLPVTLPDHVQPSSSFTFPWTTKPQSFLQISCSQGHNLSLGVWAKAGSRSSTIFGIFQAKHWPGLTHSSSLQAHLHMNLFPLCLTKLKVQGRFEQELWKVCTWFFFQCQRLLNQTF